MIYDLSNAFYVIQWTPLLLVVCICKLIMWYLTQWLRYL